MIMMSVWGDIWNGIVAGLNWFLQALYHLTGNYGIAIILLTILAKVVLLPLTIKQTRSMIAMQKVQPEIKKLQEKYKDDKEKLSQEMMKFYKDNKINPLGGCLPLLLQLPIFFALFEVLRKYLLTPPTLIVGSTLNSLPGFAAIIPKNAGFLWINNLADSTRIADPTYILLILLAASTWYSQKQVMTDPRQKNLMIIMPLVTLFIGLSLPAGVVLYWLTQNILQILQQFGIEYYDKKHAKEVPKEKTVSGKDTAKGKEPAKGRAAAAVSGKKPPPGKAAGGKQPAKKTPAKAGSAKQKQQSGSQKGKSSGAQRPSSQKGGSKAKGAGKPSQVKKPKGPPPSQKVQNKVKQGSAAKKGNTRKK